MKKNYFLASTYILIIILLSFVFFACKNKKQTTSQLNVPTNVKVEVVGRWANISWDAIDNACGYLIYTASTGCGSGNRIINTDTQVVTTHAEPPVTITSVYPFNGCVELITSTSIRIWLMQKTGETQADVNAEPMASAISAKVMALPSSDNYTNSDYSDETTSFKEDFLPAQ